MNIQICSDLHLELESNQKWMKKHPLIPKADYLIIAGDTYHLDQDFNKLEFIDRVSADFKQVFLIPGNHEYFGGYDVSTSADSYIKEIRKNVILLNNSTIEIEDVHLIFSTMWTAIQKHVLEVLRGLMDFKKIKYKGKKFTLDHYNELHAISMEFLTKEVRKEGKKIVITHHLPSDQCNVKEFRNSVLNGGFCVDLTKFILEHDIDAWVYGHSHRNKKDFTIGNTEMITNQLGYVGWGKHHPFDYEKVIEV